MKILCIGHITYDTTFPVDNYPIENTKVRCYTQSECTGGPVSVAALLLGKWNADVSIAGMVGDDDYGRKIQKEFSLNRVKTNHLVLNENIDTSHSIVLSNQATGTRTIIMYVPKHEHMPDFTPDFAPDIILLDGQEYEASKKLLKDYPNAISIIDADRDKKEIIELATKVNYLVCSKAFAEKVTGIKMDFNYKQSLVDVYNKMEIMFKNLIVITLEADGCLYKHQGQLKIMPSIKVKTVDSTGAGDIFHGAFAYGVAQGFDYEKVLKFANIAGALSVTRMGGYKSIPTLEEVQEVYDEVK